MHWLRAKLSERNAILVTGGAGFIGANLVRLFVEHSVQATVLDNLSAGGSDLLRGLPITLVEGDIRDRSLVNDLVSEHSAIVHLAGQTGVSCSIAAPERDCQVNVLGTVNLLEAARRSGVKRFVFASSNAVLGRQTPPATEEKAPLPISPYGASKLAAEGYCLAYHGSFGVGTVVLRFANVYGPYSRSKESVVAKFFKDVLNGQALTVDGDGQQTRDFIYVSDLCRAVVSALESDVGGEVFQIATGMETTIAALAALVQNIADRRPAIRYSVARPGDISRNYACTQKGRSVLGWEPGVTLPQGLLATWRYFQTSNGDSF
jgi:UDP-glucose 4-epimerase